MHQSGSRPNRAQASAHSVAAQIGHGPPPDPVSSSPTLAGDSRERAGEPTRVMVPQGHATASLPPSNGALHRGTDARPNHFARSVREAQLLTCRARHRHPWTSQIANSPGSRQHRAEHAVWADGDPAPGGPTALVVMTNAIPLAPSSTTLVSPCQPPERRSSARHCADGKPLSCQNAIGAIARPLSRIRAR